MSVRRPFLLAVFIASLVVAASATALIHHSFWEDEPPSSGFADYHEPEENGAPVSLPNDTVRAGGEVSAVTDPGERVRLWDPRREIIVDADIAHGGNATLTAPNRTGTFVVFTRYESLGERVCVVRGNST